MTSSFLCQVVKQEWRIANSAHNLVERECTAFRTEVETRVAELERLVGDEQKAARQALATCWKKKTFRALRAGQQSFSLGGLGWIWCGETTLAIS